MTGGLVMGIMLIPFVSSLSDDDHQCRAAIDARRVLWAGRHAIRNHSPGGAFPPPCPALSAVILLAVSRAIGETMIVVHGRGCRRDDCTLNPFEAMTTITVKIVSQLTGDTEFDSPETLVAFALGTDAFRHRPSGSMSSRFTSCANTGSSTNDATANAMDSAPIGTCRLPAVDAPHATRADKRFKAYGAGAILHRSVAIPGVLDGIHPALRRIHRFAPKRHVQVEFTPDSG